MIRTWIALLVCLMCLPQAAQSRTVRDFFASEPDDIFLLVPHSVRLDLLDYYDSGQRVQLANRMGDGTQIVELDSVYLKIRTSASRVGGVVIDTAAASDAHHRRPLFAIRQ